MDFAANYDKYHNLKLSCDIKSDFVINYVMFGSGGSSNIILNVTPKNDVDDKLIVKIIPSIIYTNVKIKPDYSQLEIKFYQFFTKKFILTNRTPHIVGLYNHQDCSGIASLLQNIRTNKGKCATTEDKLMKKEMKREDFIDNSICDLLLRHELKLIDSGFDIMLLEYCPIEFSFFIEDYMVQISKAEKDVERVINVFIYCLINIFFQLIFTLAIIKDDYPGFQHGDFFVRNILLSNVKYVNGEFVAYHYKQKIFYLSASNVYAKINDFGYTLIAEDIVPSTYKYDKMYFRANNTDPFNKKTDIFNLLHDVYSGQDLGTQSIMTLATDLKLPQDKMEPILRFMDNFIDIKLIDSINETNRGLLNRTWNIDKIKILEDSVLSPEEYLMGDHFLFLQELPTGGKVIKHYNSSEHYE